MPSIAFFTTFFYRHMVTKLALVGWSQKAVRRPTYVTKSVRMSRKMSAFYHVVCNLVDFAKIKTTQYHPPFLHTTTTATIHHQTRFKLVYIIVSIILTYSSLFFLL